VGCGWVGVEGNFSVSFGPKPGFRLWILTWTKLNNIMIVPNNKIYIVVYYSILEAIVENYWQYLL
jgi:hypothetical protein